MTLNWSTNWSGIGAELAAAGLVLQLLQFFSALAEKELETRNWSAPPARRRIGAGIGAGIGALVRETQ
jgi:hypothetical protein